MIPLTENEILRAKTIAKKRYPVLFGIHHVMLDLIKGMRREPMTPENLLIIESLEEKACSCCLTADILKTFSETEVLPEKMSNENFIKAVRNLCNLEH